MKTVFSTGANRDIKKILEYYSTEADVNIAMDFHADLDTLVERIKQWPESFPLIGEGLRRAILQSFPYQVVYKIRSDARISILVIRHHKQSADFGLDQ